MIALIWSHLVVAHKSDLDLQQTHLSLLNKVNQSQMFNKPTTALGVKTLANHLQNRPWWWFFPYLWYFNFDHSWGDIFFIFQPLLVVGIARGGLVGVLGVEGDRLGVRGFQAFQVRLLGSRLFNVFCFGIGVAFFRQKHLTEQHNLQEICWPIN
jgi:hypothetical protein